MFTPFSRDLMQPQIYHSLDSLVLRSAASRPRDPHQLLDPFPGHGPFLRQDRSIGDQKNLFQLFLNCTQFRPEEVEVQTIDGYIVVHCKHEERPDDHGFVQREFIRRYEIPAEVNLRTLKSVFKKNGILAIKATMNVPKKAKGNTIPVEIQKPMGADFLVEPTADLPAENPEEIRQSSVGITTNLK